MSAGKFGISGTFFSRFRMEVRTDVYPSFKHDRSLPLSRMVGQAKIFFFSRFPTQGGTNVAMLDLLG